MIEIYYSDDKQEDLVLVINPLAWIYWPTRFILNFQLRKKLKTIKTRAPQIHRFISGYEPIFRRTTKQVIDEEKRTGIKSSKNC